LTVTPNKPILNTALIEGAGSPKKEKKKRKKKKLRMKAGQKPPSNVLGKLVYICKTKTKKNIP